MLERLLTKSIRGLCLNIECRYVLTPSTLGVWIFPVCLWQTIAVRGRPRLRCPTSLGLSFQCSLFAIYSSLFLVVFFFFICFLILFLFFVSFFSFSLSLFFFLFRSLSFSSFSLSFSFFLFLSLYDPFSLRDSCICHRSRSLVRKRAHLDRKCLSSIKWVCLARSSC